MCGDVVGKAGRRALTEYLPVLREKLNLDFVVVNGENAAHGFGINQKICNVFFDLGVDVITSGNHVWDKKEDVQHVQQNLKCKKSAITKIMSSVIIDSALHKRKQIDHLEYFLK